MLGEPNSLAYIALILWFAVSAAMFAVLRPAAAAAIAVVGGVMFLPERVSFDFAALPPVNKQLIAPGGAFVGALIFSRRKIISARVGRGGEALVLVLAATALVTALRNPDPLTYGATHLPAMSLYDGVSLAVRDVLYLGLPFFLGRAFFRTSRDLQLLIVIMAVAGVFYSLLILYEIRMAPVLHKKIYGFHQHAFIQTLRFGGYRPMVFMAHGLLVAIFVLVSGLAATGLSRVRRYLVVVPARLVALYLAFILVMCKSLGALLYGAVLLPLTAFARPSLIMRVVVVLLGLIMAYPALRATDLFPTEVMLGVADRIEPKRAESLRGRFVNEELLVEKARARIWFGWGAHGRARVYDPETGRDLSTTDGYWIIQMGSRGIFGFVCAFGLLLYPPLAVNRRLRRIRSPHDKILLATLSLVVIVFTTDLLPNAFLTSHHLFLAGALAGVLPGILRQQRVARPKPRAEKRLSRS